MSAWKHESVTVLGFTIRHKQHFAFMFASTFPLKRPLCKQAVIQRAWSQFYFLFFLSQYIWNTGRVFLSIPITLKELYLHYYVHAFPEVTYWKDTKVTVQNLLQGNWKHSGSLVTWWVVLPPEGLTEPVIMYVIYPTIINSLRERHPEEAQFKYTACAWNLTFCIRFPTPRCSHGRSDIFIFFDCRYMA